MIPCRGQAEEVATAVSPSAPAPHPGSNASPRAPSPPGGYVRPRHHPWAELLRRTFAVDILACPDCGGRLRLLATIADRAAIEWILAHLGWPLDPPRPAPARPPPWLPGLPDDFDQAAAIAASAWPH